MPRVNLSQKSFLDDRQGKKFADVVFDPSSPFKSLIVFFASRERQRRMEDSEIHHDRAPLAGVVRELEGLPEVEAYLVQASPQQSIRLRQAIGVLVRIVMEMLGWRKTGKKGSLGVRVSTSNDSADDGKPDHNTGGLAFWFLRAERYELESGMPFRSVKERCDDFQNWASPNKRDKKYRMLK